MKKHHSLSEILRTATHERWAVGHFNISNAEQLKAIVGAARAKKSYVMIGLSEGERAHVGLNVAVALVRAYEEESGMPIFLNADHSKTVESALAAARAGFNSIHIDASEHPYEENVRMTREVVLGAKKISPLISVEGELGFVPGESKSDHTNISVESSMYTNPEQVADFIEKTGVDRLAVFVGNVHGLHKDEPKIDIQRIKDVRMFVPPEISLVLHAGSGIPDEDIKSAISGGIANIHINTDIRVAFTNALRTAIAENPNETTPYKLVKGAMDAVQATVENKIFLFGGENRVY